jgi:hypothetical protein
MNKISIEDIIQGFKSIKRNADRLTSGNVSHNKVHISATAKFYLDEIEAGNLEIGQYSGLNGSFIKVP